MIRQLPHTNGDRGWIVNIASILGLVGTENTASYCAAKGAVVNMTKAVALDCAAHRIHVNAICPGCKRPKRHRASVFADSGADTATRMTTRMLEEQGAQAHLMTLHPFRGLGIPDDLARAALFLASEDATWITGVCIDFYGYPRLSTDHIAQVCLPVDGGFTAH